MGQRPDADLFFGYVFNETGSYPWQGDDYDYEEDVGREKDWGDDEYILHAYGFNLEEMEWGQMRDELEKIGVELCSWGSTGGECSYYIRPRDKNAYFSTDWDSPLHIPTDALQSNDAYVAWIKPLEDFAAKMGIDLKGQTPKWHLVASFG